MRAFETPVDVRGFGAVGDGKADDTAAIQKAVDAGVGLVQLPKGVYRITKPIVIELDKVGYTSISGGAVAQIVMAGPGPALKFVGTHFKSADPAGFCEECLGTAAHAAGGWRGHRGRTIPRPSASRPSGRWN